jgi:DNA repair protein RecN (Recombination protein N)
MLCSLRVRDLATVSDVTLELGPGLNVLTGETGAGKSMLVDALALLLGDRADRASVRPGSARAIVEGEFSPVGARAIESLEAAGLDVADPLVVRREVSAEGRSRAWVNGSPTTIGVLLTLGQSLVDLHGQHETTELSRTEVQRNLLDAFGGAGILRAAVGQAWQEAKRAGTAVAELTAKRDAALQRADWLRHLVDEVDAVAPRLGEDEQLEREIRRLSQAVDLAQGAGRILELLDGDETGVREQLGRLSRNIDLLARLDPDVDSWREILNGAWSQLDDLSRSVSDYAAGVTEDPTRLATIERRRGLLDSLKQKHGGTLASVLDARARAAAELELIDTAAIDLRSLEAQQLGASRNLDAAAAALTLNRREAGERISGEISRLLPSLGLNGARFEVRLHQLAQATADGAESVEFLAMLNAGMEFRPIARSASGGELSRLMLAVKVALARHDTVATLVFDEIDQGIGGEVGLRIAAALARVAERHQVLVITHLPQIAARGDRHLRVAKATRKGVATSDVEVLHGEDRVIELARMLGNPDDRHARRLALSLLGGGVSA